MNRLRNTVPMATDLRTRQKRAQRLYDLSFPVWMLLLTPKAWLVTLPVSFVVNTAVIFAAIYLILRSRVEESVYAEMYAQSGESADTEPEPPAGASGESDDDLPMPERIRPKIVFTAEENKTARKFILRQWKRCILPVLLVSFASSLVGGGFMLFWGYAPELAFDGTRFAAWWAEHVTDPVSANPFSSVPALFFTAAGVAAAGWVIYTLDMRLSLRKLDLSRAERRRLALDLAVFTAPYLMLVPSEWFWK